MFPSELQLSSTTVSMSNSLQYKVLIMMTDTLPAKANSVHENSWPNYNEIISFDRFKHMNNTDFVRQHY